MTGVAVTVSTITDFISQTAEKGRELSAKE